jgi:hypothetical protein
VVEKFLEEKFSTASEVTCIGFVWKEYERLLENG